MLDFTFEWTLMLHCTVSQSASSEHWKLDDSLLRLDSPYASQAWLRCPAAPCCEPPVLGGACLKAKYMHVIDFPKNDRAPRGPYARHVTLNLSSKNCEYSWQNAYLPKVKDSWRKVWNIVWNCWKNFGFKVLPCAEILIKNYRQVIFFPGHPVWHCTLCLQMRQLLANFEFSLEVGCYPLLFFLAPSYPPFSLPSAPSSYRRRSEITWKTDFKLLMCNLKHLILNCICEIVQPQNTPFEARFITHHPVNTWPAEVAHDAVKRLAD